MARIIGQMPVHDYAEERLYRFIMDELPDYIYVLFGVPVRPGKTTEFEVECDAILLIPHMGVFVFEVNGANNLTYEEGCMIAHYGNGRSHTLQMYKYIGLRKMIIKYLHTYFEVDPDVFFVTCFPNIQNALKTTPTMA